MIGKEWLLMRVRGYVGVLTTVVVLVISSACWAAAAPVVLFDQGHGQQFLIGETGPLHLSDLAEQFRRAGFAVKSHGGELTDAALGEANALVLSGPFISYTPAEVAAITRFLERGGRVAAMLHVGPPLAGLLHGIGVDFSNGVIRERENVIGDDPLNFRVTRLEGHPLLTGLDGFSVYGCWALTTTASPAAIIASTGATSYIDLGRGGEGQPLRAVQAFGVVVAGTWGKGRFAVFGDDAIFQNRFLDVDNRRLADNLVEWLK